MKPVIFLDFDGVITTYRSQWEIDPEKIALLDQLIREVDADVVVSSAWRHAYSNEELQEKLEGQGFQGRIIGVTSKLFEDRGKEIDAYVKEHHVADYVVFDDIVDDILPYACSERLIQTEMDEGLLEEHIAQALKILSKKINEGPTRS